MSIYEGVEGCSGILDGELRNMQIATACGRVLWASTVHGGELMDTRWGDKPVTPRIHQFLQGFVRSQGHDV